MSTKKLDKNINKIIAAEKSFREKFQSDEEIGLMGAFNLFATTFSSIELATRATAKELGIEATPRRNTVGRLVTELDKQQHPLATALKQENDWHAAFWTKADLEMKQQGGDTLSRLSSNLKILKNTAQDMPSPT